MAGAPPVLAETTRCVDTVEELRAAVAEADSDEMQINLVRGSYTLVGGSLGLVDHGVTVVGGWDANCDERLPDPRLTVFTGISGFQLLSSDRIHMESVAFISSGYLRLTSVGGRRSVTLERVWLQDMCDGIRCTDEESVYPVQLTADYVRLDHVVATGHGSAGCAVAIERDDLREANVAHSLFVDNDARGLCLRQITEVPKYTDDFRLVVDNSVFWSNGSADIESRLSPLVTLRHNIYQSLDLDPPPENAPVASVGGNPKFQDITTRDFRLQLDSPARDSGRFDPIQLLQELDLVGDDRVSGEAPDRGPFEFSASQAPLIVSSTLDTLSPVTIGSLRWAIQEANDRPGLDRIRFGLTGCPNVIDLSAPLPDITESLFIDGYSTFNSARNASVRGFTPTLCVGVRAPSLTLDHAVRIPSSAADDTLLWVSGVAFGGFDVAAVRLAGGSNSWIFGNQFGGSLGGTALGNNAVNVRIGGTSHDNLIGGSDVSQRNLIASAYNGGIELLDNSSGAEGYGNVVRNNFIGLAASGMEAAPNALGIRVRTAGNAIRDNVISGNLGDGVWLEGPLALDNEIRDNTIGLKTFAFCLPPCTPDFALGNAGAGVRLTGGGVGNRIWYNRIRHNGDAGVRLEDGQRNRVASNSITANGALGIDLGTPGVNPVYNAGLALTGTFANRGINAPVLGLARGSGSGGTVSGQLAGRNGVHLVEIFRNASCDGSGSGEGLQPLTAGVVTIANAPLGNNGSATFEFDLPAHVALGGSVLTAVAKDSGDNSSEFSSCLAYETILCRELFRDGFEDNPLPLPCTPL